MADLNDLVIPKSDVVVVEPTVIADNGEIGVNGLPPGCTDIDACGHPYLLIPIGDCDDELAAKITALQNQRWQMLRQSLVSLMQKKPNAAEMVLQRMRDEMDVAIT